jgi:hypothetical protein
VGWGGRRCLLVYIAITVGNPDIRTACETYTDFVHQRLVIVVSAVSLVSGSLALCGQDSVVGLGTTWWSLESFAVLLGRFLLLGFASRLSRLSRSRS